MGFNFPLKTMKPSPLLLWTAPELEILKRKQHKKIRKMNNRPLNKMIYFQTISKLRKNQVLKIKCRKE